MMRIAINGGLPVEEGGRFRPLATDGEIAVTNLKSACRRAWARFAQDPLAEGIAGSIVDMERLQAQFLGDLEALDRLTELAEQFARVDVSFRGALVQAEVASTVHRFKDARDDLARANKLGAPHETIERQSLAIDQACGVDLARVLDARRRIAAESGRLEDLVPLGALLADLDQFAEADEIYRQAFYSHDGVSPFPLAWTCFQLGMLWGELMPVPSPDVAARWYRRAIAYLPAYAKARVHLAEIHASQDQTADAEMLLLTAIVSNDPEVRWRLADVFSRQGKFDEAELERDAARRGFDRLLEKYLLAFADHGAEFYIGSGNDSGRALELAQVNVANRPTRRAIRQEKAIAAQMFRGPRIVPD